MKYELIKPVNPNWSAIEQILNNRGIEIENIQHYLHTTDRDINSPEQFGQEVLKTAATLIIQTVHLNKQMIVIVD